MSQNHSYSTVALCGLLNRGEVCLPLTHCHALNVIARLERVKVWNAIAGSTRAEVLKKRAKALRTFVNGNLVGGRFNEDLARACLDKVESITREDVPAPKPTNVGASTSTVPKTKAPVHAGLDETTGIRVVRQHDRKPKGFPTEPNVNNLRAYLRKYEHPFFALTAYDLINDDMRTKAAPEIPEREVLLNPRIAKLVGSKFREDPGSGFYPIWPLIQALSVDFDVELDATPACYGRMTLCNRETPPRCLRYEIKGYRWNSEELYWSTHTVR